MQLDIVRNYMSFLEDETSRDDGNSIDENKFVFFVSHVQKNIFLKIIEFLHQQTLVHRCLAMELHCV